jgi:hypothetical protein
VEDPAVVERDRAPAGPQLPPGLLGAGRAAQPRARAGRDPRWADEELERLQGPRRNDLGRLPRGRPRRALAPHGHPRGKIANYQPYPPTPWNGNPRDSYGTPGPYEDAVQNTPIFEENGPENFKGVDIMRPSTPSTRACPAACTCTARARSARWCTRRPGWLDDDDRAPAAEEELVGRVQELTAQVETLADPRRGPARELAAAVVQLYGEGLERIFAALDEGRGPSSRRTGSSRASCSSTACTR